MQDVKSYHLFGVLVALLFLAEVDNAKAKVIWELVQPKVPPPEATAAPIPDTTELDAQRQTNKPPWPVSTVEVCAHEAWHAFHIARAQMAHKYDATCEHHLNSQCFVCVYSLRISCDILQVCLSQCTGDDARRRVCRLYNVTLWSGKVYLHSDGETS